MLLRPSVSHVAFNAATFAALQQQLRSGALSRAAARLPRAPKPLPEGPEDLTAVSPARARELRERGEAALAAGKVAALVMNGGMATRFGGGAKGVVPVVEQRPRTSFLALKLADLAKTARAYGAAVPVVVMNSFATAAASSAHLEALDWAGVAATSRHELLQSIMPRVRDDARALEASPGAESALADTDVYSAPGHGDTLGRLRETGLASRLREQGVEHILISNVDNVGARVDPVLVGAHDEAVAAGAAMTVEVVARREGDAGGCVALHPDTELPAIIEGFRLPEGVDLATYPHFNTNTLWFSLDAVTQPIELQWFPVRKTIELPGRGPTDIVQFEQLIGQASERVPSAFVAVDRDARFLPIKTRAELAAAKARLAAFADDLGLLS